MKKINKLTKTIIGMLCGFGISYLVASFFSVNFYIQEWSIDYIVIMIVLGFAASLVFLEHIFREWGE